MLKKITFIAVVALFLGYDATADWRSYVWTYQYMTMPQGRSEIEFYHTIKTGDPDSWEYRIELEHGITDRLDAALYQIFKQNDGGSFAWDAVQFRTRYRFGERDAWFVNPLLYLEYNRPLASSKPNKFEVKAIIDKNIGAFNMAVNPVYELFFAPGVEHEAGVDVAASYRFLSGTIGIGAEISNRTEFEDGEIEAHDYIGPTLSYKAGTLFAAIGAQFGVSEGTAPVRGRSIIGLFF